MRHIWSIAAVIVLAAAAVIAQAEVTGNIGWDSDYVFRGVPQSESSASGGIDWEGDSGFYLGTWAADVGDGLEIDYYGGWGGETDSGFSYSVGYTLYDYTGDFDEEYQEVNLGVGFGWLSLDISIGEWDGDGDGDGDGDDYTNYELTAERNGFFVTLGSWGDDFDADYLKLGYGTEIAGIDVTSYYVYRNYYVYSNGDLIPGSDSNVVVQVSKSFSFEQVADAFNGTE